MENKYGSGYFMSKEISSFYAGWIKAKDPSIWTKNFEKIILFYLFSTPCCLVSSSSTQIFYKKWDKNVWKTDKLRNVLLSVASLTPKSTYISVDKQDDMTHYLSISGLSGIFQSNRVNERICFVTSKKGAAFLDVLYYIRCALAHGRFQIYDDNGTRIYVLESGKVNKTTGEFTVLARMVLRESTLIAWADILDAGQDKLDYYYKKVIDKLTIGIVTKIKSEKKITKKDIASSFPFSESCIYEQIQTLSKAGKIRYLQNNHTWIVCEDISA